MFSIIVAMIVKHPLKMFGTGYAVFLGAMSWSGIGLAVGIISVVALTIVFVVIWSKVDDLSEKTNKLSTKVNELSTNIEQVQEVLKPKVE